MTAAKLPIKLNYGRSIGWSRMHVWFSTNNYTERARSALAWSLRLPMQFAMVRPMVCVLIPAVDNSSMQSRGYGLEIPYCSARVVRPLKMRTY